MVQDDILTSVQRALIDIHTSFFDAYDSGGKRSDIRQHIGMIFELMVYFVFFQSLLI